MRASSGRPVGSSAFGSWAGVSVWKYLRDVERDAQQLGALDARVLAHEFSQRVLDPLQDLRHRRGDLVRVVRHVGGQQFGDRREQVDLAFLGHLGVAGLQFDRPEACLQLFARRQ